MSAADSFTFFHTLPPPELRLRIWRDALSVPSVWAAVHKNNTDRNLTAGCLPFIMAYIGPAPYLAGLSSWEARRLLEQFYVKPIRGPSSGLATSAGSYWVDLDTTVIYLGDSLDAMTVLNSFGADELLKFKHVALLWNQFGSVARTCQRLATICPALRTIIIQRDETEAATDQPLRQPLSVETAAYYATLPGYPSPDLGYEELDAPYFQSLILEYFGDSPPKFHLLSPDSTNRSS
ncbi:uncharacterized protein A1O5_04749 [Cladophialophora psammophila CBS 110553]|uniref:Uncharacterized protein n=1 Tax=Cladophialophora psammophila CBS 110553 TaxID=1182543 RepID=W9X4J2_9EURO|nr:uncharacterized protein A1O5_04749 [Cladophialophora psammophila CBS 110553]EXJ72245.1 hypothetical protein A1O5_04749 [Cladophialophora psammophila CBS 110553]